MDTEMTQRWCDRVLGTAQVWETHSQGVEVVTDPKIFHEPMKMDRCWVWGVTQCSIQNQIVSIFQGNLVVHKTCTSPGQHDFKFKRGARGLNAWEIL